MRLIGIAVLLINIGCAGVQVDHRCDKRVYVDKTDKHVMAEVTHGFVTSCENEKAITIEM